MDEQEVGCEEEEEVAERERKSTIRPGQRGPEMSR